MPVLSAPVTWSRPEAFGAWVRFGDSLLVAVDHGLAAKLGVAAGGGVAGGLAVEVGPLEVHIAVTSRCYAPCAGCYLDARPDGTDVPFDELVGRLREARAAGASTVAFGGGEPLLREDLPELAAQARGLGLVPVLTTSGVGLTAARARTLRDFAQINVSHDGAGAAYEAVRGYDGAAVAERAIGALTAAGVACGVNFVVTRASFEVLLATAERAAELGAGEMQLLRYKPAGRAASATYVEHRLTEEQVDGLWPAIGSIVSAGRVRVRIDCAMVPLLSVALVARGAALVRSLGVFGCEAARHLGAREASGAAAPCSFLRGTSPAALREYHARLPEPCDTCSLVTVCRGGCQAVALHESGHFSSDPECPRVREHRRAGGAAERSVGAAARGGWLGLPARHEAAGDERASTGPELSAKAEGAERERMHEGAMKEGGNPLSANGRVDGAANGRVDGAANSMMDGAANGRVDGAASAMMDGGLRRLPIVR